MFHKSATAPAPRSAPAASVKPAANQAPAKPVVQPDLRATGQVAMVNTEAKFVVVTFPGGNVPENGRMLSVFRDGSKIAELKVTGPQREADTVADIISGDVQVNDQVRVE
jgi:hypothetical protein